MLSEGFLQRMQSAIGAGQPFDGDDLGAMRLHGEYGAGFH
jgi:hypothetical protein